MAELRDGGHVRRLHDESCKQCLYRLVIPIIGLDAGEAVMSGMHDLLGDAAA